MNGNPVEIMHTDQGWFDLQNELIGIVDRYMEPRALICMRMDFTSDLCKLIEKYRKYNTGLAKQMPPRFGQPRGGASPGIPKRNPDNPNPETPAPTTQVRNAP